MKRKSQFLFCTALALGSFIGSAPALEYHYSADLYDNYFYTPTSSNHALDLKSETNNTVRLTNIRDDITVRFYTDRDRKEWPYVVKVGGENGSKIDKENLKVKKAVLLMLSQKQNAVIKSQKYNWMTA